MKRLAVLVAVLLTACAYPLAVEHKDYPLDWAKPAPAANGCPDLGGRYLNQGRAPGPPLARWALPQTSTPMEQIRAVELDGPREGVLSLRFFAPPAATDRNGPLELGRRQWKQGEDFNCENGWLVLSKTKVVPLTFMVGNETARFTLAADRSLVVERSEESGGVLVVLPAYLSSRDWQSYPRTEH